MEQNEETVKNDIQVYHKIFEQILFGNFLRKKDDRYFFYDLYNSIHPIDVKNLSDNMIVYHVGNGLGGYIYYMKSIGYFISILEITEEQKKDTNFFNSFIKVEIDNKFYLIKILSDIYMQFEVLDMVVDKELEDKTNLYMAKHMKTFLSRAMNITSDLETIENLKKLYLKYNIV